MPKATEIPYVPPEVFATLDYRWSDRWPTDTHRAYANALCDPSLEHIQTVSGDTAIHELICPPVLADVYANAPNAAGALVAPYEQVALVGLGSVLRDATLPHTTGEHFIDTSIFQDLPPGLREHVGGFLTALRIIGRHTVRLVEPRALASVGLKGTHAVLLNPTPHPNDQPLPALMTGGLRVVRHGAGIKTQGAAEPTFAPAGSEQAASMAKRLEALRTMALNPDRTSRVLRNTQRS